LDLDENLSEEALDEKNAEYLETFPRRPSAALVQLIHDRCGTQKELSLRAGISEAFQSSTIPFSLINVCKQIIRTAFC